PWPRVTKRRPIPKPRPFPRGSRRPWAGVHEPYGLVSEPFPGEPEPSGSEHIRWVQDCLNQALGLRLSVTGVMGPETRRAVQSFQRQQGLRESGIVGPDTEGALKAACGGRSMGMDDASEYVEESELGPLTATLRWIGPPDNPTLFTREEASRQ